MSVRRRSEQSVTLYNPSKAYNGYTIIWLEMSKDAWLIDMEGHIVHRWRMPGSPGLHGRLLSNGNLVSSVLVKTKRELGLTGQFSGLGGLLLEVDWEGNPLWEHKAPYQEHDFYRMDNGNTLYISWDPEGHVPPGIAAKIRGGMPGTEHKGVMRGDVVREVNPAGEVVWKWLAYEHLDPEIDILCPLSERSLYPCINSVFSMPDGDILLSLRHTDTVAIIDKATGDVKWRWGPGEIAHQHDASLLDNGNILLFDNGCQRRGYGPTYSRVVEVNPATGKIEWEYKSDPPSDFYTSIMGGCERLPNGNTLITESMQGRIFEVTHEGEMVWEYVVPFYAWFEDPGYYYGEWLNALFRAHRYGADYAGLRGRDLDPGRFDWVNRVYGPDAFRKEVIQ